MQIAGREELDAAIQQGHIDSDGIPYISVYLDGGWSKRSYGHNYNAASGVVSKRDNHTKSLYFSLKIFFRL